MTPLARARVYLLTDPAYLPFDRLLDRVVCAARAGVDIVQYRGKSAPYETQVGQAARLKAALDPLGVPLIVNDRPDVARAVNAAGVHVGAEDMRPADARAVFPGGWLGVSCHSAEQVRDAERAGADYAGIGPVFDTRTKLVRWPVIGPESLSPLFRDAALPLFAIGGIGLGNIYTLAAAGVTRVAVISAVLDAPDPAAAARALKDALAAA